MNDVKAEIASHTPGDGMAAVRLHGGPWDGKDVGVRDPEASFIRVNGPRHGQHSVWITHLYERRGDRYEHASTEVVPLSAWRIDLGKLAQEARMIGALAVRPSSPVAPEVQAFAIEKGIDPCLAAVIDLACRAFPSSSVRVSLGQDAEDETHHYVALDIDTGNLSAEELLAGQREWSGGMAGVCPSRHAVWFVLGWQ